MDPWGPWDLRTLHHWVAMANEPLGRRCPVGHVVWVLLPAGNLDRLMGRRVIAQSKKKLTGHVIAEDKLFDVVRRTAKVAEMPPAPAPADEGFSATVTPSEAKFTLPAPTRKRFEWHLETMRPNCD